MNENSFSKDDPAINEHHYHITEKQYNGEAQHIYNIDNTKTYNIKNNRHTDEHYYNKTRNVNNNVTNNIGKHITSNSEHVLILKKRLFQKLY